MEKFNSRISNMSFIDQDGVSTVVLHKTKNQLNMKCSWVLFNASGEGNHNVTIQIENFENKVIYKGDSVVEINDSLQAIQDFDYEGNKAFGFLTNVKLDKDTPIWDELKSEEVYKVSLFLDNDLKNVSSSYFLLKESD